MNARQLTLAAATALAAGFAVAALPAPAEAQFGGLLKKAKEKAAEKAAEKAVDKAAEKAGVSDTSKAGAAAGGSSSSSSAANGGGRSRVMRGSADAAIATGPAPTYTANLLEITNERIDQLFKGLKAERGLAAQRASGNDPVRKKYEADMRAYEAKQAAYDKKTADINARIQAYTDCSMSNSGAAGPNMMPGMAKMREKMATMSESEQQAFMNRLQDLGKRGEAAEKRGDKKTMIAITDTVNTLMGITEADRRAAAAAAKNRKDCGAIPPEMSNPSLMPTKPERPQEPRESEQSEALADKTGANAAGLTVAQYGLLRERVAALVIYNGRPGRLWGFSENERKVVATRRSEFNSWEDVLGGQAVSWQFSGSGH